MPTVLTKDYLAGLAKEAAAKAAAPVNQRLAEAQGRLDSFGADLDAQRRSLSEAQTAQARTMNRADALDAAAKLLQQKMQDQYREHRREVASQLNKLHAAHSDLVRKTDHNAKMLAEVLKQFAKWENRRGQ